MDSDTEYTCYDEFHAIEDENTQELADEPATKKIKVNIPESDGPQGKKSYVWFYFKTEEGRDICKIIKFNKGKEVECGKDYKHDGSTGNMKNHLLVDHGILPPNAISQVKPGEKHQIRIDEMVKKVAPHRAPKQAELKRVTTEWLVTDSLPFSVVHGKGYRKMINRIDPAFVPPSYKSIKIDLFSAYQKGVLELKKLISTTCETASITTDLWTSRNNDGYIGITLHWLTPDFEVRDMVLAIEHFDHPHTGERIRDYLYDKIKDYKLSKKVFCAVTDNGSNMKKALRFLGDIDRLSCSAHTLQLTVNKALKTIEPYTEKIRKLILFFRSPKQCQRLDQAQKECSKTSIEPIQLFNSEDLSEILPEIEMEDDSLEISEERELKILRTITDSKTRWNSTYYSWKRLLALRKAIIWLSGTLHMKDEDGAKEDSRKLKDLVLEENEWKLLEEIVKTFKPFDELTTYFSGIKYATLSVVNTSIEALKHEFFDGTMLDEIEENISDNDEIDKNLSCDDNSIDEISENNIPQQEPPSNQQIISNLKKVLYNSLCHYWDDPDDNGLIATLLDPRLKAMSAWHNITRNNTIEKLRTEFETWQSITIVDELTKHTEPECSSSTPSFMERIFNQNQDQINHKIEIDNYLNTSITPIQPQNIDVYQWWHTKQQSFPILSRIARKYLSVPATSVPSERLFSDAGNQITPKRTRLAPEIVSKILFVKRNSIYCKTIWS